MTDLPSRVDPADYTRALTRSGELLQYVDNNCQADVGAAIDELRQLAEQYAENEHVADNYAMALILPAYHQPTPVAWQLVEASRGLVARWPKSRRICTSHACTLANAIARAHDFDPGGLLTELLGLVEQYDHDDFFDQRLAHAMKPLVERQQVDVAWGLSVLRTAACAHSGNELTVGKYLEAVLHLMSKDPRGTYHLVGDLESFLSQNPYLPSAREALAQALNILIREEVVIQPPAWDRLYALAQQFPQDTEVGKWYARGMANATSCLDAAGRGWAVGKLTEIARTRPDDPQVAEMYALGLFNLSLTQDEAAQLATAQQLRHVLARFPSAEIALNLARVLFNLAKNQTGATQASLQAELAALGARFPQQSDIEQLSRSVPSAPWFGGRGKRR